MHHRGTTGEPASTAEGSPRRGSTAAVPGRPETPPVGDRPRRPPCGQGRRPPLLVLRPLVSQAVVLLVLLPLTLALGCTGARTGLDLPAARAPLPAAETVPIVLVPGTTGTALVAPDGDLAWGSGLRVFFPRDRGHGLVLPLDPARPDGNGAAGPDADRRPLRPGRVLREIRLLGVVRMPVYQPLIRAFESRGYVAGSLATPRAGDTFLTFPYDWRQDNVDSARALLDGLERLRQVRRQSVGKMASGEKGVGDERLEVDLVCQSSAAHLCRWLVKYGGATLEEVEAAEEAGATVEGLPPEIRIRRLVLVGASNAGSLRTLFLFHRGRTYLGVGRYFAPETLFTFRSLYQDLPLGSEVGFLDSEGRPLDVDLYDARTWIRHGWSVFDPRTARRLEKRPVAGRGNLLGTAAEREAFLARQLDRARRFQRALARDVDLGGTRYLLVQNGSHPTMTRAVLRSTADGWRTLFPYQDWFDDHPWLHALSTEPGDLHATLASQRALSPRELASLAAEPVTVPGGHFDMILEPATLRWLVEQLAPVGGRTDGTAMDRDAVEDERPDSRKDSAARSSRDSSAGQ